MESLNNKLSIEKTSNFKNNLINSKWLIGLYLIFVLGFAVYQFGILGRNPDLNVEIFTIILLIAAGMICIYYQSKKGNNKNNIHKIAAIIILIFGLISIFYAPILVHCDEDEHFVRSELTSHGEFVPIRELQPSGKIGFSSIQAIKDLDDKSRFDTIFTSKVANSKINTSQVTQGSSFAQNPFYAYIPQGIGVAIAKALDLNAIWMLWLGGLFNLIMYTGVCTIAIKKAPMFKIPLMAIACLPFSIQQATSLSSDATVIAFSILVVAYFLSMYKSPDKSITWKKLAKFFILCLIVTLVKVPYLIFVLLILLLPRRKFINKKTYGFAWLGIIILSGFALLWNHFYAVPSLDNSFRGTRAKIMHVDTKDQLSYLLHNPGHAWEIFKYACGDYWYCINDMFRFADWQGTKAYSSSLMTVIFIIFYGLISILYPIKEKIANRRKLGMLAFLLLAYFGIHMIEYLTWTPLASPKIAGIQGRYFIPLLLGIPFILAFNYKGSSFREKISQKTNYVTIENIYSYSTIVTMGLLACMTLLTVAIYY